MKAMDTHLSDWDKQSGATEAAVDSAPVSDVDSWILLPQDLHELSNFIFCFRIFLGLMIKVMKQRNLSCVTMLSIGSNEFSPSGWCAVLDFTPLRFPSHIEF